MLNDTFDENIYVDRWMHKFIGECELDFCRDV